MDSVTSVIVAILGSSLLTGFLSHIINRFRFTRNSEKYDAWLNESKIAKEFDVNTVDGSGNYLAIISAIRTSAARRLVPSQFWGNVGFAALGIISILMAFGMAGSLREDWLTKKAFSTSDGFAAGFQQLDDEEKSSLVRILEILPKGEVESFKQKMETVVPPGLTPFDLLISYLLLALFAVIAIAIAVFLFLRISRLGNLRAVVLSGGQVWEQGDGALADHSVAMWFWSNLSKMLTSESRKSVSQKLGGHNEGAPLVFLDRNSFKFVYRHVFDISLDNIIFYVNQVLKSRIGVISDAMKDKS